MDPGPRGASTHPSQERLGPTVSALGPGPRAASSSRLLHPRRVARVPGDPSLCKVREPSPPLLSQEPFLRSRAGRPRCTREAGSLRLHPRGWDPEAPDSPTHSLGPLLQPPDATAKARGSAPSTPPAGDRAQGPNSIVPALMNSRALISSPRATGIYASRLCPSGPAARQTSLPKAPAWGLARGSVARGPGRRSRETPEPGPGPARPPLPSQPGRAPRLVLSPRPGPRSPGAYLQAPGSPELPSRPRRPKPAPAQAPTQAGGKSRSPHPRPAAPHPRSAWPAGGKAGRGRPPASPFSPDSFDPRVLRRTSAPGLPGSARGDPGNGPQLISFHQAALGRLETAEPVIAFFRRPSADWTTANQRLVYTR